MLGRADKVKGTREMNVLQLPICGLRGASADSWASLDPEVSSSGYVLSLHGHSTELPHDLLRSVANTGVYSPPEQL